MDSIKVVEKTPGKHIEYTVKGEKITFGDEELTVKLSAKERDEKVVVDICMDKDKGIMMGTGGAARSYAAQVEIPPRRYEEQDSGQKDENGRNIMVPVPLPFDMSRCTLILWGQEEG